MTRNYYYFCVVQDLRTVPVGCSVGLLDVREVLTFRLFIQFIIVDTQISNII